MKCMAMCAGFVHLYSGQEAVSTGVIRHLQQDDYICSTYRDHVHALSKVRRADLRRCLCRRRLAVAAAAELCSPC